LNFGGLQMWLRPYAQYLYDTCNQYGQRPRVTSVYRSPAKQRILYERYIRGESSLPAAPPGKSKHQFGLAFDMVTEDPDAVGAFWKQMGGKWWASDPVHFEV